MIAYTGIGSRSVINSVESDFVWLGNILAKLGLVLRSGGAVGCDSAFEAGCDNAGGKKEIYLPWKNFSQHNSQLYVVSDNVLEAARTVYPFDNWNNCKPGVKRLMGRNCQQVAGVALDNFVDFVVCYTEDGCEHHNNRTRATGGTGQAISYASLNDIPVFNFGRPGRRDEFLTFIEKYT